MGERSYPPAARSHDADQFLLVLAEKFHEVSGALGQLTLEFIPMQFENPADAFYGVDQFGGAHKTIST